MKNKIQHKKVIDKESQISSTDIDNCIDVDTLKKFKETIAANLMSVKSQLEMATAKQIKDGEYSDPEWWARANAYKRVVGYLHQKCQMKEREINFSNKTKTKDVDINAKFKKIAREILGDAKYLSILSLAHQAFEKENGIEEKPESEYIPTDEKDDIPF